MQESASAQEEQEWAHHAFEPLSFSTSLSEKENPPHSQELHHNYKSKKSIGWPGNLTAAGDSTLQGSKRRQRLARGARRRSVNSCPIGLLPCQSCLGSCRSPARGGLWVGVDASYGSRKADKPRPQRGRIRQSNHAGGAYIGFDVCAFTGLSSAKLSFNSAWSFYFQARRHLSCLCQAFLRHRSSLSLLTRHRHRREP